MTSKRILYAAAMCAALLLSGCQKIDDTVPAAVTIEKIVSLTEEETMAATAETAVQTTAVTEPPEKYVTVSFAATGDNLIHSSIYNQAHKRSETGGYDFVYAYRNVEDLISEADIAIINQETLICNDEFEPSTYPCFNSPTELGNHMIDIGFDVFTIANNHTLDKGVKGLNACLDYWDGKEDVVVAGAYRNAEDKADIRTNEVNGVTFSYLSYTESLNGLSLPSDSEMIIGNANDIDGIIADIGAAKEISDICVVSLHWGVENSDVISDHQREYTKQLADAGADIIIGTHPHVLRDIEVIEKSDGSQTLCAYSLGNFISAQSVGQNLIGGVLQFDITYLLSEAGRKEAPEFSNIKLIPIVTHYDMNYSNVRLYKFSEYTDELARAHGVRAYSTFSYDYITEVLKKNINSEYLILPEIDGNAGETA